MNLDLGIIPLSESTVDNVSESKEIPMLNLLDMYLVKQIC